MNFCFNLKRQSPKMNANNCASSKHLSFFRAHIERDLYMYVSHCMLALPFKY